MENDIKTGLINTVYIKDLSRISRNMVDAINWLDKKRRSGIAVKSMNDDLTNMPLHSLVDIHRVFRKRS
jgi:DNA invertase Pin-like site-specific DNA recombinase